jgi:hypothetical protein
MTRPQSTSVEIAVLERDGCDSERTGEYGLKCPLLGWPEARGQLKNAGVEYAYVEYVGHGDSWEMASLEFRDSAGQSVDLAGQVLLPVDHFRDLVQFWLEARLPPRREADGSYGEVEWTLGTDPLGF